MASIDSFRVIGLCAAPFTPFKNEEGACPAVDFAAIETYASELVRQGVKYAFVCGSTGEGVALSVAERKSILEAWIAASKSKPLSIIAHVGTESIADVMDLAAHAQASGAVAVAAMPTSYNKPFGLDSIVDFLAAISTAAPSLPLYYYHIAIKTGVNIRCDKLLEKVHSAIARVPTFRGIKYTDFDMHIFANCVAFADGKYDILSGRDEVLLAALAMGATGAVGSTYNYMGRVYNALIEAFKAGDWAAARALQRRSQWVVNLLMSDAYGAGVNVGKAMMDMRVRATAGAPVAGAPVGVSRYPAVRMTTDAAAALEADLRGLGFFDF